MPQKESINLVNQTEVYWFFQELNKLFSGESSLKRLSNLIRNGQDAVWRVDDPFPFLVLNFVQIPWLKLISLCFCPHSPPGSSREWSASRVSLWLHLWPEPHTLPPRRLPSSQVAQLGPEVQRPPLGRWLPWGARLRSQTRLVMRRRSLRRPHTRLRRRSTGTVASTCSPQASSSLWRP